MKRLIFIIILIASLFIYSSVFAAGTVTQAVTDVWSYDFEGDKIGFRVLTFTCIGSESGETGSIPSTATTTSNTDLIDGWFLVKAVINAGETEPTDNSDVYLYNEYSVDMLGGGGVDQLDATGANEVYPMISSKGASQPITGAVTLTVSNNAAADNRFTVILIFSKYPMSVNGLT